jgi:radical SAM/Cys-rich protein
MNEFESRVAEVDRVALSATAIEVLQLNLGLRCNLCCTHCHQSSSPDRTETMSASVFAATLELAGNLRPRLVDLTGGAPELHPRIRDHVAALRGAGLEVQLRTNLTLLLDAGYRDLPDLWARQGVRLLASLPSSDPEVTTRQRGAGAFEKSIAALRVLNTLGYGQDGGPRLDLASNPDEVTLPGPARPFEERLRRELGEAYGIRFTSLVILTNVPIGRFGGALDQTGARRLYLDTLRAAFNPAVVPLLACRKTLAVSWDGRLFDCDFNVGAERPLRGPRRTVFHAGRSLTSRRINFGLHCFACTANAGSS